MTIGQALQEFFEGFGMKAYPTTAVPNSQDLTFPYLTYETPRSYFGGGEVNCTVNMWFYTSSEAAASAKADELSAVIGRGGLILHCDDGALWLRRGSPWVQSLSEAQNNNYKRRIFNLTIEFFTP